MRSSSELAKWIVRGLGLAGVVVLFALPCTGMDQLPDRIPTHFGRNGQADGFGAKTSIWALAIIGAILFFVVGFLEYFLPSFPTEKRKNQTP